VLRHARKTHYPSGPALGPWQCAPRPEAGPSHSSQNTSAHPWLSSEYLITDLSLYPAKSLLFAPGIVVEARNRSALIARVEAGKSGIHIVRIILHYVPAGQSARPQPIPVPRLTAASSVRG